MSKMTKTAKLAARMLDLMSDERAWTTIELASTLGV